MEADETPLSRARRATRVPFEEDEEGVEGMDQIWTNRSVGVKERKESLSLFEEEEEDSPVHRI